MKVKILDFTKSLESIDKVRGGVIREKIYDILYKLYGLSIAEKKDPEVVFGQTALSIILSSVFYEHISNGHSHLRSLSDYIRESGYIEGLRRALEDLLRIDYREAIGVTLEILDVIPRDIEYRVKDLVDIALKITSKRSLLKRDFAGRVYHEITGDIALRKGFATFYTEIPAAYLLATLAIYSLLGLDEKNILEITDEEAYKIIERIKNSRYGDFACGSGTLLTAVHNTCTRIASALKYYYDLDDVNPDEIARKLVEENIYGIDALKYASQITAINLALLVPTTITKENVYTIYLGYLDYIPVKGAWLGSLELLVGSQRVGGILGYLERGLQDVAGKVTIEGHFGRVEIPDKFDVIIMNPPFARPTLRSKEVPEEERSFFGFITEEQPRKELKEKYSEILEQVTEKLRNIAKENIERLQGLPEELKNIIEGVSDEKLRQYLNIGLAGEALPFLYLAYKYINEEGGVIAFVLPRAVLSGVQWFLARVLLASEFHVKYVIVSSDPERGYNFSEGSSLSEVLLVAKRVREHKPDEETVFVILTKKPRISLEGMLTAERIIEAVKRGEISASLGNVSFIIKRVKREELLKYIDNWYRFASIPEPLLSDYMFKFLESKTIPISDLKVKIPLVRLHKLLKTVNVRRKRGKREVYVSVKAIGIDAKEFYTLYNCSTATITPYPALKGTEERFRSSMKIRPNAYLIPKNEEVKEKAIEKFNIYAGRILLPGVNIWYVTSRVIVLYSDQKMLSNTHYAIKLNVDPSTEPYAEKALVLWFNTTWGLLTILINREETRGGWAQVKMGQWLLMPVLDVASLDSETIKRLAGVFDRYAEKQPRRIPEQFNPRDPDPIRLGIDIEFLEALNPELKNKHDYVKEKLLELYKHIDIALKQWIG